MLGLILCGGLSLRMGSDKGLLMLHEKTWAETAMHKLQALDIPVRISVNPKQFTAYTRIFSTGILICDTEELSIKGPLLGIISAHIQYPHEDIFVLACDMLQMEPFMLEKLMDEYNKQQSGAYVYSISNNIEPLCGIYTAGGLQQVLSMHEKNMLTKHSMKFVLEQCSTNYIPLNETDSKYFSNSNAPGDLPA